jgi:sugar phosphate isomerase/epimerase
MEKEQISISTCFDYNIPVERQLSLVSEAGFTHISLGQNRSHFDYLSKQSRKRILKLLNQCSLRIDTIHGPEVGKTNASELASIAESAVELQAPVVVLHGGPFDFGQDELGSRLIELRRKCQELDTISRRTGVMFALENVSPGPATELVRRAILETDPAIIGFCYDSSHHQIGGPNPFDLLLELIDRLVAVHLSDRVREFVDHVIPGEGFIEWGTLCPILRASKMTFPLLLEVMVTHSFEKDPVRFLSLAFKSGRELHHQICR